MRRDLIAAGWTERRMKFRLGSATKKPSEGAEWTSAEKCRAIGEEGNGILRLVESEITIPGADRHTRT
jgi:hypothetical protein